MGGSASSSPAVQKSLANFMDAAMSTTVDGLRSTGKRIKKGNAALSDAMSDAYDEVNLLDPARQIGLTSQGRGDPSVMRSINTPLVAGAQMGLGAANADYRGTANLLGQGVEGVRSALPKSLSDYVGTGAQFERDFNAMPEFLAGTGFGLIPASVPPIAKGFTEGTAARNAERGMVLVGKDLLPIQIRNATPKTSPKQIKEYGILGSELGTRKLAIPIQDMMADVTPLPLSKVDVFNPQDLELGGTMVPLWGDMSRGGGIVEEINGVKLASPVRTYGGRDFASENPEAFWASMAPMATRAKDYFNTLAKEGTVYPSFTNMGARSLDSSSMMTDALIEQLKQTPLSGRKADTLTKMVRNYSEKGKPAFNPEAPSFRKLDELQTWLQDQPLNKRMSFINSLDNNVASELGIPDIPSTRFAISDQSQIGTPMGSSGTLIGEVANTGVYTGGPLTPLARHPGYDTLIKGINKKGGFAVPVPSEIMYPDTINDLLNAGYPKFRVPYLMQRGAGDIKTAQKVTTQYRDSLSKYIENLFKQKDPFEAAISRGNK